MRGIEGKPGVQQGALGLLLFLAGLLPLAAQQPADQGPASPGSVVSRALGEEFRWTEQRRGRKNDRDIIRLDGEDAEGADVGAAVDVQTDVLVYFHRGWPGGLMEGKEPAISAQEALKRAEAFLSRVGVPLREGGWTLVASRFFDHGTAGRDYEFGWSKYFHGVRLPAGLSVHVNGDSGLVSLYSLRDDPLVVPLVVRVPAAQAVRVVVRRSGMTAPVAERAGLFVGYRYFGDRRGPQALCWSVQLRDTAVAPGLPTSVVLASVDANTGEIVHMMHPPQPVSAGRKRGGNRAVAAARGVKLPPPPKLDLARARKAKLPPTVFELARQQRSPRR